MMDKEMTPPHPHVKNANAFASPCCKTGLRFSESDITCTHCGRHYHRVGDIYRFIEFAPSDHGELSREKTLEMGRRMREHGWRNVIKEIGSAYPNIKSLLVDPGRNLSISPLKDRPGTVLDFGCGYGGVSLSLARQGHDVFAVDGSFERLSILSAIKEQEDIQNITLACHQDVLNLPFTDGSLDAIVMIGVFEYLPATVTHLSVEAAQLACLREFKRILKDDGRLWMMTKNRFGWHVFQGKVDNSGIRFGSILPLGLANLISRMLMSRPYRIVSNSYSEYRQLFEKAGFKRQQFFWPAPGYQNPITLAPLDSDYAAVAEAINTQPWGRLKKTVMHGLAGIGLLKWFVPNFGILGSK